MPAAAMGTEAIPTTPITEVTRTIRATAMIQTEMHQRITQGSFREATIGTIITTDKTPETMMTFSVMHAICMGILQETVLQSREIAMAGRETMEIQEMCISSKRLTQQKVSSNQMVIMKKVIFSVQHNCSKARDNVIVTAFFILKMENQI